MSRSRIAFFMLFVLCLFALNSEAQTKGTVNFGKLKNLEFINGFYDGGTGSLGSGPGPNYGLQFTANAQAIISAAKGGSGNFINNPGGLPVMFFQTGTNVTITATNGVSTAIWFYYSALQSGQATLYSGPNGTGSIVASVTLPVNNSGCTGYAMCVWTPVGFPLSATVGSIRFGGVPDYLAIGIINLGKPIPTTLNLVSSQNPSVTGQAVTFTATVAATGAAPVGSVTFREGSRTVGVVPVTGGVASITLTDLKSGTTLVTAHFQGAGFAPATQSVSQVVN